MKIIKYFFTALICLALNSIGLSQAVKEPNFTSPNAGSLGKFGDVPVSYHTGVANISIPIYTVQEGSLSAPITLSYHSSGVKVDDVASWVGLGWALDAGGMISRTIVGGPDEGKVTTYGYVSDCGKTGWYKDYGMPDCLILDVANCGSTNPGDGRGGGTNNSCYARYRSAFEGNIDTEPDIYNFNFPGGSGKFFFDENRQPHMIPENDFFITPVEGLTGLFDSWKILAPDGTKYFFGGSLATENNHSSSVQLPVSPNEDNRLSTTWYLTRIESVNGQDWINFEYESENYSYGTKASQTYVRTIGAESGSYTQTSGVSVTNIISWRLSKITTSSGFSTVDFIEKTTGREDVTFLNAATTTNTQAKALEKIQVSYGGKCSQFVLDTDYFQSDRSLNFNVTPETVYDSKRLRLNSVRELTCDLTAAKPPYVFTYNTTIPLPRRYSFAQDHWGYHNGKSTNTTLLPPFIDPANGQQRPGADREPVEAQMFCGILTKIVYPTGGSTDFVYEAHRENESSPNVIGGLRIKSIVSNDGAGGTTTKNYDYPTGIFYQGTVSYQRDRDFNFNIYPQMFFDFGMEFSSSPEPPLQNTQGYHIGYSVVEVVTPGNGKMVFRYTNTHPVGPSMYYPRTPTVAVIGTAELYQEQTVGEDGNTKRTVTYQYGSTGGNVSVSARKIVGTNCLNTNEGVFCEYPYPIYLDYTLNTFRNHVVKKTEVGDGVTTITDYTYDASNKDNFPRTAVTTSSDLKTLKSESVYPSDAGSGAPAAMYNKTDANFKNMLGATVEQRSLVNNVLKSKSTVQFTQSGSNVLPTSSRNYPSGTTEFIEDQYQYDDKLNVTSILKSNGVNKAFLWGYNANLPIAAIENATYQESLIALNQAFGVNPTANVSSCTNLSGSFTINEDQTVSFSPSISLNGATGLWVKLTMKNGSGNTVFGPRQYAANGTYNESIFLTAGTYTFCYEAGGYPSPYTGYSSVNFIVNGFTGRRANLFHTSFEENGIGAAALTGSKVLSGTYAVNMPHINGDYILSFWKRPDTGTPSWEYVEVPITISASTTPPYTIGQSGYYIDEVRLYPKGALMSTYTYDPGMGMTSATDPNNITSYYQYDAFGRLVTMKNDKGEIVKTYEYHLKN